MMKQSLDLFTVPKLFKSSVSPSVHVLWMGAVEAVVYSTARSGVISPGPPLTCSTNSSTLELQLQRKGFLPSGAFSYTCTLMGEGRGGGVLKIYKEHLLGVLCVRGALR